MNTLKKIEERKDTRFKMKSVESIIREGSNHRPLI